MGLLTRREVIDRLRITPGHFSKIVNGKVHGTPVLPSVKLGRRQLFREQTVEDWIAKVEAQSCNVVR